jgi:thiol-disulfide isomerase/thioredoxin
MKRRQRIRTITIVATLAIIAVSLVVGFYIALNVGSTALDKYDGVAISSADVSSIYRVSHADFGQSGSSLLVSSGSSPNLKAASGSPYLANGKPIVVYIGADFCPYCAVERWSLIMALSRFGNFSNLHYMTSGSNDGDYATFTFTGSSYSSKYVVFQAIEQEDRSHNVIASIPSNYSAEFQNAYPFVNFGNRYILSTLIPDTTILTSGSTNKNWTQIFNDITTSDSTGTVIKEGANAITALICRLTSNQPASVCNAYAITSTNIGLAGPWGASEGIMQTSSSPQVAPMPILRPWS